MPLQGPQGNGMETKRAPAEPQSAGRAPAAKRGAQDKRSARAARAADGPKGRGARGRESAGPHQLYLNKEYLGTLCVPQSARSAQESKPKRSPSQSRRSPLHSQSRSPPKRRPGGEKPPPRGRGGQKATAHPRHPAPDQREGRGTRGGRRTQAG